MDSYAFAQGARPEIYQRTPIPKVCNKNKAMIATIKTTVTVLNHRLDFSKHQTENKSKSKPTPIYPIAEKINRHDYKRVPTPLVYPSITLRNFFSADTH